MLLLTRETDQKIVIQVGTEIITVMVCQVRGDRVRLGFQATEEVQIDRQEVYESKQRNQPRNCA